MIYTILYKTYISAVFLENQQRERFNAGHLH